MTYVVVGYAVTFGAIAAYAIRIRMRTRALRRVLGEDGS